MPILSKPEHCIGCPLYAKSTRGFVAHEGSALSGLAILGEAGGKVEYATGKPFQGPAGHQLDRVLWLAGVRREGLLIDNCVKCQPPGDWLVGAPWEQEAIAHCKPLWQANLVRYKPRCTIALGQTAAKVLTGMALPISDLRGYVIDTEVGWVVPTFHPSFLLQGAQSLIGIVQGDVRRAARIAAKGFAYDAEEYIEQPSVDDFTAFAANLQAQHYLAVDIETPTVGRGKRDEDEVDPSYTIIRCSFSYEAGKAISIPWMEPYTGIAKRLLATENVKVTWEPSQGYDQPRLKIAGCTLNGWWYNAMRGWKAYQPGLGSRHKGEQREKGSGVKPNRLEFVAPIFCNVAPWKHLADARPEFYSCRDGDVEGQLGHAIEQALRGKGIWEAFVEDERELMPLLTRIGDNGLRVDKAAQEQLSADLDAKEASATAVVEQAAPPELRKIHPPDGYVRVPKDTTGMEKRWFNVEVGQEHNKIDIQRWCRVLPFNPNSPPQVLAYLKHKSYKIPKHAKTGADTSEGVALERLAKQHKDPLLIAIGRQREVTKERQYIWPVGPDGRVRTHFDLVSTGRLDSFDVNLQNVPKRAEDAWRVRRTIIADPGCFLLEADLSSIEPLLTGYFAGDEEYMRVARLGMHTYMAGHLMGCPIALNGRDLKGAFKEVKEKAKRDRDPHGTPFYDVAKRGNNGMNYRLTEYGLQRQYPDTFVTIKEAAKYIDTYYSTIAGKVKVWQERVIEQAAQQHYLRNPFGRYLWLWDIWKKRKGDKWEWKGEDANLAVALLPQGTAAMILRRTLLALRPYAGDHVDAKLCLTVHDQVLLNVRQSKLYDVARHVKETMTRPWPELGGLSVGVEITYGRNWAEASKVNPDGMRVLEV